LSIANMSGEGTNDAFWGHAHAENEHLEVKRTTRRFQNVQTEPLNAKYLHSYIYELLHRADVMANVTHHALNTIPRVVIQLDKLHVGGYVTSADLVATLRIHLDFVSMETLEERPWLYAKPIPYPDFELPPGVTLNGELWKPNNPTFDKLFYGTFDDTFNGDVDEDNKWHLPPPHPEEDRYQEYYDHAIFHTFPHHKPVVTATSEGAKQAWLNAEGQLAGLRKYLAKRITELTA